MISYENFGWICSDDFVQIYSPDFGREVGRWLHCGSVGMLQLIVTSLEWKVTGPAMLSCITGLVLLIKNQEVTIFNRSFLRGVCRVAASFNNFGLLSIFNISWSWQEQRYYWRLYTGDEIIGFS